QLRRRHRGRRHASRNAPDLTGDPPGALRQAAYPAGHPGGRSQAAADGARGTAEPAEDATEKFVLVGGIQAVGDLLLEGVPHGHVVAAAELVAEVAGCIAFERERIACVVGGRHLVAESVALVTFVEGVVLGFVCAVFGCVGFVQYIGAEWSVHRMPSSVGWQSAA